MDIKDFFQESSHPDYLDIKRQLTKQLQEKEQDLTKKAESLENLLQKQSLSDQEIAVAKRELENNRGAFRQEMDFAFAKLDAIQQKLDTDEKLNLAEQKLRYADLLVRESDFNTRIITVLERVRDKEYLLQKKQIELDAKEQSLRIEDQRHEAKKILFEVDKKLQEIDLGKRELSAEEREKFNQYRDEEYRLKNFEFEVKQRESGLLLQAKEIEIQNLQIDQRFKEVDLTDRERRVALERAYNEYNNIIQGKQIELMKQESMLLQQVKEIEIKNLQADQQFKDVDLTDRERRVALDKKINEIEGQRLELMSKESVLLLQAKEVEIRNLQVDQRFKEVDLTARERLVALDRAYNEYSSNLQEKHFALMLKEIDVRGREISLELARKQMELAMKENDIANKQMIMEMVKNTFSLEEKYLKQMGEKQVLQMQVQQLQVGVQLAKLNADAREAEMIVREKLLQLQGNQLVVDKRHAQAELQEKANAINITIMREKDIIQNKVHEVRDREFQTVANKMLQEVGNKQHFLDLKNLERDIAGHVQSFESILDKTQLANEWGKLETQKIELVKQESEMQKEQTKMLNYVEEAHTRENYARLDALEERKRGDMLNTLLRYG